MIIKASFAIALPPTDANLSVPKSVPKKKQEVPKSVPLSHQQLHDEEDGALSDLRRFLVPYLVPYDIILALVARISYHPFCRIERYFSGEKRSHMSPTSFATRTNK